MACLEGTVPAASMHGLICVVGAHAGRETAARVTGGVYSRRTPGSKPGRHQARVPAIPTTLKHSSKQHLMNCSLCRQQAAQHHTHPRTAAGPAMPQDATASSSPSWPAGPPTSLVHWWWVEAAVTQETHNQPLHSNCCQPWHTMHACKVDKRANTAMRKRRHAAQPAPKQGSCANTIQHQAGAAII